MIDEIYIRKLILQVNSLELVNPSDIHLVNLVNKCYPFNLYIMYNDLYHDMLRGIHETYRYD